MRLDSYVDGTRVGRVTKYMNKKQCLLVLLVVGLAAVYAVFFTNWFQPRMLRIHHTSRPRGFAMRARRDLPPPIVFGFDESCRLTEIKVVPLAGFQTNQNVLPLWHLISDSNSVPVEAFTYGQMIRGMKPAIKGTHPESLEPNTTYRLFVVAGNVKGEHDFEMGHK